ncbi:glycosyltransferase [Escherichia coli]|uniref:Glycosyltransferase n=3 Tax=Escherichia coli TaxID=562 RepID=A0AAW5YZA5_ECOLX|nr:MULTISPECIES: glycosyltransferase [Enterobacteriaceae]EFB2449243.1 glycosyltransferase [Escherichia coli]EFB4403202.1 glycosyltransferase [Escherichia coli]EFB4781177.1 glycosyltransferase [Escherichia coli]EFE8646645.1 glycosyltransferase [Escherichia coli]EFE9306905.1 glycosyltransferase [Escherichia coli]
MKIVYVITGLTCGGAEHLMIQLADQMCLRGHDVNIICLSGVSEIKPVQKIDIHYINMKKNVKGLIKALVKVKKLITSLNPDLIHSHMFHANIFSRIIRVFTPSVPLICTAHNKNEGGYVRMLCYRLSDFLASITTNVSQEAVQEFIKKKAVPKDRIIEVPNFINTDIFNFDLNVRIRTRNSFGIKDNTLLLLAVGRLVEAKDYPNLLNAISYLIHSKSEDHKDLILLIAGDGKLKDNLLILANKLNIADKVFFLGLRRDIKELMCASDLFVLSSEWEGFGLVVAEAMACERLVIATDSGGVKEVVGPHNDVIPVSNHILLAEKIAEVLKMDDETKKIIGMRNREHIVSNFSIQEIVSNWECLYSKYSRCTDKVN